MKKEKNIDFVSLLQNETFLNLVKDTDSFVNQLDILDKAFPGKRDAVAYVLEFLKANLADQKKMSANDVISIWQNVRKAAGQKNAIADEHRTATGSRASVECFLNCNRVFGDAIALRAKITHVQRRLFSGEHRRGDSQRPQKSKQSVHGLNVFCA